jgi:HAMP domain-containing protein
VLAVLVTTGVLCYGLAKYFSSPVIKLRAATQQLAKGDLSARVGAAKSKRRWQTYFAHSIEWPTQETGNRAASAWGFRSASARWKSTGGL